MPTRIAGGWDIPVGDGGVAIEGVGHPLVFAVGSGISITIEGNVLLSVHDRTRELEPSSEDVADALERAGVVTGLRVLDSGRLEIGFDSGTRLSVPPAEDYESFQLYEVGPQLLGWPKAPDGIAARWDDNYAGSMIGGSLTDQFIFIGRPGGGISSYSTLSD